MAFKSYSKEFISKAMLIGYSAEIIEKCLLYANPLIEKDLPVIFNISHFAGLVGYKKKYLQRAIVFTYFFYRHFQIKKNNGSKRQISEPLPSLKEIQCWILTNILYKLPVSKFAKAYILGTTLKQNLVFHRGQYLVLNLDIKDFFGNIRRPQIERIFRHVGYSFLISNLLSKLCCLNECLPQGAPTSPALSNLIMVQFDHFISEYCLKNKICYTRYADDLSFSGDFDFNALILIVKKELKKLSLELNENKSHLMTQSQRQTVTGIVVNNKIQVSRTKRKEIRQEIYYIKTFGLEDHLKKIECNRTNYISHLIGKVLHVLFINPNDEEFISYKYFLNSLQDI